MCRTIFTALIVGLLTGSAAYADFFTHYNVHMDGADGVTGIIKFETVAGGGGASWPDRVQGAADTTINQVFGSAMPRLQAFLLGMSYEGYADPPFFGSPGNDPIPATGKHLVLFMNNDAADAAVGQDFSSVFPTFSLTDVIDWVEIVGLLGTDGVGDAAFEAAANSLSAFIDAASSSWFDIPLPGALPGQFKVVSFDSGNLVGSGTVTQTSSVPEPSTLALSLIGIAGLFVHRRRRQSGVAGNPLAV